MSLLQKIPFIVFSLLLLLLISSAKKPKTCTYNFDKEASNTQKEIIKKLCGEEAIDNTIIKSRYTDEDKNNVRNYLKSLFSKASLTLQEHNYGILNNIPKGVNLYTIIPSTTESTEYILLGAHYDSVKDSPGANDNASGVAMVYCLAIELSTVKNRTKNIIVAFFDEEEKGLIGSKAFAKMLKEKNYNIHSAHTVDQMGWDADGDFAIELELPTKFLERTYLVSALKHNIPVHITNVASTDHEAFRREGYNSIGITEEYKNSDTTPHYHKSSDTYDTINFEYLLSSTHLMFCVIKELISK